MTIYFGQSGEIAISRDSFSEGFSTVLASADVNVSAKRFGVEHSVDSLMTGDKVTISTVDKSTLQLVSGHNYPDWNGFIYIDKADGIKLFSTFEKAVTGASADAVALSSPSSSQQINIATQNDLYRHVANIKDFELTTNRDQVDITTLGKEFKDQYASGLVSGQGSMTCLWEHIHGESFKDTGSSNKYPELPIYLAQLVVRLQQGAIFDGRFYIYKDLEDVSKTVYYESKCVVTNVALTISATEEIEARIEFITSGEIALKVGAPDSYLLQEDTSKILQEDGSLIVLQ